MPFDDEIQMAARRAKEIENLRGQDQTCFECTDQLNVDEFFWIKMLNKSNWLDPITSAYTFMLHV